MLLLSSLTAAAALASAAPPARLQGIEVHAPGPNGPLAGTLLQVRRARAHVVLIIPGSGPTDRNGNSPIGVAGSSYRLLAEGLAGRGVSSVRIDKRGMFGSAGAGDANAVIIPDYVRDVHNWVSAVRRRTSARCVWLLGHSEGALVALASAQSPAGICGIILAAGPGRRVSEALRDQLRASPGSAPFLEQALAAVGRLEAGERVDPAGMHPAIAPLFAPQVQDFLISLFSYDPAELIARVRLPVLILQGTADIQVAEQDARRLAAANPAARLVLLPGVSHVLKQVAGSDRAANVATYTDPNLPLANGVAEAIAEFVKQ
jgi:hypothetical protein